MIGTMKADVLVVGGEPRVDLLPQAVRRERAARAARGRLGIAVIAVAALVVAGIGLASICAMQAQAALTTAQDRAVSLLVQQRKYTEVRTVRQQMGLIRAGQQVGASTEIDWRSYLTSVQQTLPADVTLKTVTVDSASPLAAYVQSTVPLQGARVATLSFTAESASLPQVPAWLDALATLPGYTDASPGSVKRENTGTYTVDITMHINSAAFTKRFAAKGE
jgi:hypothetical protein